MVEQTTPLMAAQPAGGATADTSGNSNESKPSRNGRRSRNRATRKKQEGNTPSTQYAHIPKEKFMGRSDDLHGYIYDVEMSKGGVAYTRTTEELARHVGEKYTSVGSYVRTAILTLSVPSPARPIAPVGQLVAAVLVVD